jgi:hypothetical protein
MYSSKNLRGGMKQCKKTEVAVKTVTSLEFCHFIIQEYIISALMEPCQYKESKRVTGEIVFVLVVSVLSTDKKENLIFLIYIRKFRMEQLQSHID